jgi:hypothetical protein
MDINEEQRQLGSIRRGFAEMEAGHYIPHEAMRAWLLSLGSRHELPPPKCVCGESHDEPRVKKWNGITGLQARGAPVGERNTGLEPV